MGVVSPMQPLFEHRRRFAGADTRVLELEGDGPPVVLLHGFADSADTWRPMLAGIARAGRSAIAVDLPGFGTAAKLQKGRVLPQMDRFVADVVRKANGGDDVVLAGNSLGGALSLRAAQRPELPIAGVIPIAPAGFDMAGWFVLLRRNPALQAILAVPSPVPTPVVREVVGRVYSLLAFSQPGRVERGVVEAFTSHHSDTAAVARYMDTARRLLPELGNPFDLKRIEAPILLIWGDRDRLVSHRGSRTLLAELPDTRFELLPGCGHCPQIEEADRLVELVLDWPEAFARAA